MVEQSIVVESQLKLCQGHYAKGNSQAAAIELAWGFEGDPLGIYDVCLF